MVSVSLGLGTMVGWKRIVKTVGEKIGKQHMSYAQGASAELIAAGGIGLASAFGLPVSTTHMLSSGIAGSMVAKKGLKNLQKGNYHKYCFSMGVNHTYYRGFILWFIFIV
jgi:PiT family inorganic phosphate transporter